MASLLAACETTAALRLLPQHLQKENVIARKLCNVAIRFLKEKNISDSEYCFILLRADGRESVHSRLSCIGASPTCVRRGIIKGGVFVKSHP